MAIIQLNNINKSFAGEYILKNISFSIDRGDKIGLIGENGCGKTTLIKIMLENEEHDISIDTKKKGTIVKKGDLKIGHLSQHFKLNERNSIFEEMINVFADLKKLYNEIQVMNVELSYLKDADLEKKMKELAEASSKYEQNDGYNIEYKIKQVLNGLGIYESTYNNKIANLSGGQKSRVSLAKILLEEPELLILDEPTNHLDIKAIEWLEKFLKSYNSGFLLVSHDRYFLDNVVNRIYEIENKNLKSYKGNFSDFLITKDLIKRGEIKAYEKEQDKIKKTEEFIIKYKAGIKCKQARGREKILNRLERMDNPDIKKSLMKLKFKIERTSSDLVYESKKLSMSYGDLNLFSNLNFKVYRGDRIGIIGKNGIGKSTLLKILHNLEKQISGEVIKGTNLTVGYYDQNQNGINFENTIIDEIRNNFPLSEEEARSLAGAFLFPDENIFKEIKYLSGGEKARVSFMKLILEKPNVLIFDEPTNHLDIYSREILEESLKEFSGTLIVVSHDRYFLESTVNKIYEVSEKDLKIFNGNYDQYKNKIAKDESKKKIENNDIDYEEQKKLKNRIRNLKSKYENMEEKILELEEEKMEIELKYEAAGRINDYSKLVDLQIDLDKKDEEIENLMIEWDEIETELKENEEL